MEVTTLMTEDVHCMTDDNHRKETTLKNDAHRNITSNC